MWLDLWVSCAQSKIIYFGEVSRTEGKYARPFLNKVFG